MHTLIADKDLRETKPCDDIFKKKTPYYPQPNGTNKILENDFTKVCNVHKDG